MAYKQLFALLSAASGFNLVQSTTVLSIFLPDVPTTVGYAASVVSVGAAATTFTLNCQQQVDVFPCIQNPITLIEGPSTVSFAMSTFEAKGGKSFVANVTA
jgi:hypothetical protein